MTTATVGITAMFAWGICGVVCMMVSKRGSVREAASALMSVLGFGFMFVLMALNELSIIGR